MSTYDILTLSSDDEDSDIEIMSDNTVPGNNTSRVATELTSVEKARLLKQLNLPETAMVKIRVMGSMSDRRGLEGGGITAHCRVLKEGRLVQQKSVLGRKVFGPRKKPFQARAAVGMDEILTISDDEPELEPSPVRKIVPFTKLLLSQFRQQTQRRRAQGNQAEKEPQSNVVEDAITSPPSDEGEVEEEVSVEQTGHHQETVPVQLKSCRMEKQRVVLEHFPLLSENQVNVIDKKKEDCPKQVENDQEKTTTTLLSDGIVANDYKDQHNLVSSSSEVVKNQTVPAVTTSCNPAVVCSYQEAATLKSSLPSFLPSDPNDNNLFDNVDQNLAVNISATYVDKRSKGIATVVITDKPDVVIVDNQENKEIFSIRNSVSQEGLAQCSFKHYNTNAASVTLLKTIVSRKELSGTEDEPVASSEVTLSSSCCPVGYTQANRSITADKEVAKIIGKEKEANITQVDLFGREGTLGSFITPATVAKNGEKDIMSASGDSDVQDPVWSEIDKKVVSDSSPVTVLAEPLPVLAEEHIVTSSPASIRPTLEIIAGKHGQLFLPTNQLSQLFPTGKVVDVTSMCNKLSEDFILDGWSMSHISLVAVVRMLKKYGDVFGIREELEVKQELAELEKMMDVLDMKDSNESVSRKFCLDLEGIEKFMGVVGLCRTELVLSLEMEIKNRREEARSSIRLRSGTRRKKWMDLGKGTVVVKRAKGRTTSRGAASTRKEGLVSK